MSGHSKWSQIRHKKAITDAKRAQVFTKMLRVVTMAARNGADPSMNPALASAVARARAMNVPNDNIGRAIKKVSEKSSAQLAEITVEAIGPGGCAVRITGITDNSNRTIAELKKILVDHGAKMVQPGSTAWMFNIPLILSDEDFQKLEALREALDNNDNVDDVDSNIVEPSITS